MNRSGAIVLLAFVTVARADKIPAAWKARYRAERQIIQARNFDGFKSLFSLDYQWARPGVKVKTYKAAFEELEPFFKAKKITMKQKLIHIGRRGETIEVGFDANWTFVFGPTKATHYHEVGIDSWKKVDGKWLIFKTVDTVTEYRPCPVKRPDAVALSLG